MDKSCDTCLYGIRVEDNKLGCLYAGICHTPKGEKTAWKSKKEIKHDSVRIKELNKAYSDKSGRQTDIK